MNRFTAKKSYINLPMLLRTIGWLLMIETCFMAVPTVMAFFNNEQTASSFLVSFLVTLVGSFILMSLKPKSREMGKREAILLTSLTWVILSLFGMLPFVIGVTKLSVTDAFFETMSGFTTTGASILNTLKDVPRSLLLWRCIVQWIGGMGIILFTLAVVPMLNYQGGMQLFNAEVTGITHDKLRPRVSYTAKSLWLIYTVLTLILIVLLEFSEMDFFNAICYGLSTMSTGGFATADMTISEWDNLYVKSVMTLFMFLGGINFSLIYKGTHGEFKSIFRNDALKAYCFIILLAYALFCVNVWREGLVKDITDLTIDPIFQAVSIISSTGLTEPDFNDWGALSVITLIVMMFVGACAGSTSGGAKIDRIIVLVKFLKNEFFKMMHPSAVTTVTVSGKGTSYIIVQKVLAFLFLYLIVILLGATVLSLFGIPLKDSFFCALSAISNTGLGTDITGINGNYSLVPPAVKWILSFIMLTGRLELFTILLLFTRSFWRK